MLSIIPWLCTNLNFFLPIFVIISSNQANTKKNYVDFDVIFFFLFNILIYYFFFVLLLSCHISHTRKQTSHVLVPNLLRDVLLCEVTGTAF